MVGVIARDLVIISVGPTIVKIVGVELAESSAGVKSIRAIAVDSAKILVWFIVIN